MTAAFIFGSFHRSNKFSKPLKNFLFPPDFFDFSHLKSLKFIL